MIVILAGSFVLNLVRLSLFVKHIVNYLVMFALKLDQDVEEVSGVVQVEWV